MNKWMSEKKNEWMIDWLIDRRNEINEKKRMPPLPFLVSLSTLKTDIKSVSISRLFDPFYVYQHYTCDDSQHTLPLPIRMTHVDHFITSIGIFNQPSQHWQKVFLEALLPGRNQTETNEANFISARHDTARACFRPLQVE